jgi:hypothetical protein
VMLPGFNGVMMSPLLCAVRSFFNKVLYCISNPNLKNDLESLKNYM